MINQLKSVNLAAIYSLESQDPKMTERGSLSDPFDTSMATFPIWEIRSQPTA